MNYWWFITATLIDITPLTLLIAYFSHNTDQLKSGLIWVGAASLLAYGIYVAYDYWWKK